MELVKSDNDAMQVNGSVTEVADFARRRDTVAHERRLWETSSLIDDLACALETQAAHARDVAESLGHPADTIAGELAQAAAIAQGNARRLIDALAPAATGLIPDIAPVPDLEAPLVPSPIAPPPAEQPPAEQPLDEVVPAPARRPSPPSEPARTLALELRLDGAARGDVETFLRESFGIADAGAVVDEVFGPSAQTV